MSQATFSVRMDEGLKRQFDGLCQEFGMTASTAINVFARAVVRERRIPFDIAAPEPEAFGAAVAELDNDPARRAALASRCRALVDDRYNFGVFRSGLRDVYARVLGG